ncbi:MAG: cytochrome P450 [Nonomuraea sp.]|nr:cytochrome P450 [Nonomuraea sp.]
MPEIAHEVLEYLCSTGARGERAHDLFSRLAVRAPVVRLRRAWIVSGHALVTALAGNPALVMPPPHFPEETRAASPSFVEFFCSSMSTRPAPDHRRLRGVLTKEFSGRAVERLRAPIQALADRLLDGLAAKGGGDFVSEVAVPLPVLVTCAMLDVPEEDRDQVLRWAKSLTAHIHSSFPGGAGPDDVQPMTETEFARMRGYVSDLVERRHGGPDLISRLNAAKDAGTIGHDEVVNMIMLLFMTGFDTVTVGLTNTLLCLDRHPGVWQALRDDPGLAPAAFAEAVRLHTPVVMGARVATGDVELGELSIRRGDTVLLLYAAANLDPVRFPDPSAYRLDRERGTTMSFGHGTYFCIGAALAPLQAEAVLRRLARATPVLDTANLRWREELAFNGPAALPLSIPVEVGV